MNKETQNFIENAKIDELFTNLNQKHKPIKPKISKEKLKGIGLIIVKFQRLEHTIKCFVVMLSNSCNDQTLANIMTVRDSFSNLLLKLSALSEHRNFHKKEDLDFLIIQCYRAEEIRNQINHSIWTVGPRFKTILKKNKGVRYQSENYTPEELLAIADKIDKIDTSISALDFEFVQKRIDDGSTPNGVRVIKG